MTSSHAVVTGLGAVTAFGFGAGAFWAGLRSGETTIAPFGGDALFDASTHRTGLASAVDLEPHRSLSRADLFAWDAATQAVEQAFGASGSVPAEAGVFFGSSTGALLETERFLDRMNSDVSPLRLRELGSQQHNGPGDAVARSLRVQGPVVTVSSACASSTMALAAALDAIRSGEVEVAITGGSDELSQLTYAGFNSLRAVDAGPTRPFREARAGLSLGEGAGVLVLESESHARSRGATPLARLAGASSTCDAHHMSAPLGDGSGAARAIQTALADAGLGHLDVDFVNVHGTGTQQNDAAEWQAMQTVFQDRAGEIPIVASKSLIGHLLGASGAIEALATVLCLRDQVLPPADGGGDVDPALPVNLVLGEPLKLGGAQVGVSTNLAFGGANSALVLTTDADPEVVA